MIKSSAITNGLSITMAGLIINYLFSSDWPALVIAQTQITDMHRWTDGQTRQMDIYHENELISNHYYVAGDKLLKYT